MQKQLHYRVHFNLQVVPMSWSGVRLRLQRTTLHVQHLSVRSRSSAYPGSFASLAHFVAAFASPRRMAISVASEAMQRTVDKGGMTSTHY